MNGKNKLVNLNKIVLKIKDLLCELENESKYFPALNRNSKRALASLKMIELNVSDPIQFDLIEK